LASFVATAGLARSADPAATGVSEWRRGDPPAGKLLKSGDLGETVLLPGAEGAGAPDLFLTLPADGLYAVTPQDLQDNGYDLGTLDPRTLKVFIGGTVYDGPHHTEIYWNGVLEDDAAWGNLMTYEAVIPLTDGDLITGVNTLSVVLRNDTELNTIYVNKAILDYSRDYQAEGDSLAFGATGPASYTVDGFTTADAEVYDISDAAAPILLTSCWWAMPTRITSTFSCSAEIWSRSATRS
jgi:hypothetical protein